jgi:hypothetical protein
MQVEGDFVAIDIQNYLIHNILHPYFDSFEIRVLLNYVIWP